MKYVYKCEFIGTPECEKCMLSNDDGVHINCMALGRRPRCPGEGCREDCPLQSADYHCDGKLEQYKRALELAAKSIKEVLPGSEINWVELWMVQAK